MQFFREELCFSAPLWLGVWSDQILVTGMWVGVPWCHVWDRTGNFSHALFLPSAPTREQQRWGGGTGGPQWAMWSSISPDNPPQRKIMPEFKCLLCRLFAVWLQPNCLTSLSHSSVIFKRRIIIIASIQAVAHKMRDVCKMWWAVFAHNKW